MQTPASFATAIKLVLSTMELNWLADVAFKADPDFADVGGVKAATHYCGGTLCIYVNVGYEGNVEAQVTWHSDVGTDFVSCASTGNLYRVMYDLGQATQFAQSSRS